MAHRNRGGLRVRPRQALSRFDAFKQQVSTFAAEHPIFVSFLGLFLVLVIVTLLSWLLLPVAPLFRQRESTTSTSLPSTDSEPTPVIPSNDVEIKSMAIRQAFCNELPKTFAIASSQTTTVPDEILCEVEAQAIYGRNCDTYISRIDMSDLESFEQLLAFHVTMATQSLTDCKAEQSAIQSALETDHIVLYKKGYGHIPWASSGISTSDQAKIVEKITQQKTPVFFIPPGGGITKPVTTLVDAFRHGYMIAISYRYTKPYAEIDTQLCGNVLIFTDNLEHDFTLKMTSGNNPIDTAICTATEQGSVVGVSDSLGQNAVLIPKSLQPASAASNREPLSARPPINEHIHGWGIETKPCGGENRTPYIYSIPPAPLKSPTVPDASFCEIQDKAIVGEYCEMYLSKIDVKDVFDLEALLRLHTAIATKYLSECKDEQLAMQSQLAQIGLYRKGQGRIAWADSGITPSDQAKVLKQIEQQKTPLFISAPDNATKFPKTFAEAFDRGYLIAISYKYTSAFARIVTNRCGPVLILNDGNYHKDTHTLPSDGNEIDEFLCKVTAEGTVVAVEAMMGENAIKSVLIPQALFQPAKVTSASSKTPKTTGETMTVKNAGKVETTAQPSKTVKLALGDPIDLSSEEPLIHSIKIPTQRRVFM